MWEYLISSYSAKNLDSRVHVGYDFIFIKFKDRQNQFVPLEVREMLSPGRGMWPMGHKGLWGAGGAQNL